LELFFALRCRVQPSLVGNPWIVGTGSIILALILGSQEPGPWDF